MGTHSKETSKWKSAQRRRKHCALAVVRRIQKFFCPTTDPFPGVRDSQNLISWTWSLPLPTDPVWWGLMHAISSYRGNRATYTQTHTPTHRQDRLQYTALQLASVQCKKTYSPVCWTYMVRNSRGNVPECIIFTILKVSCKCNVNKCQFILRITAKK